MLGDNTHSEWPIKQSPIHIITFVNFCLSLGQLVQSVVCAFSDVFFSVGSDGILSEARWLLDNGLLPNSNSATRAIGYRQVVGYFPDPFFLFYIYLLHIFTNFNCLFILFNFVL